MIKDSRTGAVSGYDLFRLSEYDQEQAELARLLYVAATRAADYLILSSGLPEAGSAKGPWTELLGRHFDPMTGASARGRGGQPHFRRDHAKRGARIGTVPRPASKGYQPGAAGGPEAGRGGRAAKPRRPDREGPADGCPGRGTKTEVSGGGAARCGRAAGIFLLAAQRRLARPVGSDATCRGGGRRARRAGAAGSPGIGHAGSRRAGPDRPGPAGRGGRAGPPPCPAAPWQRRRRRWQQRWRARRADRMDPAAAGFAPRRGPGGRGGKLPGTGISLGLAARPPRPGRHLPARIHRLPLSRCVGRLARDRLQDQPRRGRPVGRRGRRLRNANARLRHGGGGHPGPPARRVDALFPSPGTGIPVRVGRRVARNGRWRWSKRPWQGCAAAGFEVPAAGRSRPPSHPNRQSFTEPVRREVAAGLFHGCFSVFSHEQPKSDKGVTGWLPAGGRNRSPRAIVWHG